MHLKSVQSVSPHIESAGLTLLWTLKVCEKCTCLTLLCLVNKHEEFAAFTSLCSANEHEVCAGLTFSGLS